MNELNYNSEVYYTSNVITSLLIQATNFALSNGFTPELHRNLDEKPANFATTLQDIQRNIFYRIEHGIFYASLYFNEDQNQFSLDSFKSHNEMLNDYLEGFADDPTIPKDLIMASFTKYIKVNNEQIYFTLEIVLG